MERPGKHLGSHLRRRRTQLVFDSISDLIVETQRAQRKRERERQVPRLIALNAVDCKLHLTATPFASFYPSPFVIPGLMPDQVMMKLCYAEVEALGDKVSKRWEIEASEQVLFSSPVFSPPFFKKELRMRSIRLSLSSIRSQFTKLHDHKKQIASVQGQS